MNAFKLSIRKFVTDAVNEVQFFDFLLHLIMAVILGVILQQLYIRCGNSVSNRRKTASNFVLLACVTMIVISIVKSSLALSLGLVGALSIVRFRAAIKEPEELTYLFIAISIGLGMGAGQPGITCTGFGVISLLILPRFFSRKLHLDNGFLLTVSNESSDGIKLSEITEVLEKYCSNVRLNRYDYPGTRSDFAFHVQIDDTNRLDSIRTDLVAINDQFHVACLNTDDFV